MGKNEKPVQLSDEKYVIYGGSCELDNEERVPLAVVCEIIDYREIDSSFDNDEFPIAIKTSITATRYHKEILKSAIQCNGLDTIPKLTKNMKVEAVSSYMGGVPFNIESVTSVTEDLSKFDNVSELRDSKALSGGKFRCFKDVEHAEQYINEIIVNRVPAIFGLIGFILDRPINLMGSTGWSFIKNQVQNIRWF